MNAPLPLSVAISIWKRGENIPLDLWATLSALGFDVPTLEDKYLK